MISETVIIVRALSGDKARGWDERSVVVISVFVTTRGQLVADEGDQYPADCQEGDLQHGVWISRVIN